MLSGELGTPVPTVTGVGAVANCGDSALMNVTTSAISASDRIRAHAGIAVPYRPCRTDCIRSSSVGTLPLSVDRILYLALVKSRGWGVKFAADAPSPRPDSPWHSTQWAS